MTRRNFLGRRPFRRRPLNLKWGGNQQDVEATRAAGGQDEIEIVSLTDYQGGTVAGNVEPGATTLMRIRGCINLRATIIGGLAFLAIVRLGANEAARNIATDVNALTSGDVLWWDTIMVPIDTPRHLTIDVKAKRKLEDDRVVFLIRAVAQAVTYQGTWRVLLKSSS